MVDYYLHIKILILKILKIYHYLLLINNKYFKNLLKKNVLSKKVK